MKKACVAASKTWCKPFTCMLVKKLPRELRDMIYKQFFTLEKDEPVLSMGYGDWALYDGHANDCYPCFRQKPTWRGPYPPHFAHSYYVHETFAKEIAETLYERSIMRTNRLKRLDEVLSRDFFHTGCSPADHIRCIELELPVPLRHSRRMYDKSAALIEPIFKIKRLKAFRVRIRTGYDTDSCCKFEEVMTPLLHALHRSGVDVTV